MPLHDWNTQEGWENLHSYWIVRIADAIWPRLPDEYRVYIGSYSLAGLALASRPDVAVARDPAPTAAPGPSDFVSEPDDTVAVADLAPQRAVYVQRRGMVVAAIELVSPGNKDRPAARADYLAKFAGYVRAGIHLLLVDLHPQPYDFSFADAVAADLALPGQPAVPAPSATTYRVNGPSPTGGSYVSVWRRPLAVGSPLPSLPLPLSASLAVTVDLEETYMLAAARAYLS